MVPKRDSTRQRIRGRFKRCAERIGDAARILEAQNEVLYAEERANAKPRENER